jgi:hypothetical protein
MLKVIIVILLLGIVLSLVAGGVFFFKDQGKTKRTMIMLGVRVTLAILLMATVTWGVMTGELTLNAPWLNADEPPQREAPVESEEFE